MAIRPEEFWGSNYYNNPPLTDEMIATAERQLGVRLPRRYIQLLRIQNGGYTSQPFAYPLVEEATRLEDCITFDELHGIVLNTDSSHGAHNILRTEYMTKEWDLPPQQALLAGDGHTWLSLDYRDADEPSVVWLDAEMNSEKFLAESFDEFLDALRPASELED